MIKRKHILHLFGWIALLAVLLAVAGIFVVRSERFHHYVLAKLVQEASEATGGRVEIRSFKFQWSGLRLDLNNIILHGAESASSAPLLQVYHLQVGLKIISLWRRRVDLSEIIIDHPVIHMSVDKKGTTNLPTPPPPSPGSTPTSVFDLAVGHFVVNHGDLEYKDRSIPLAGDLHDLNADVSFSLLKTQYTGSLGYLDGRIQFGDFNPLQHNVQLHFSATPAGLTIDTATLTAGPSSVTLNATLKNYSNPSVDGSYKASVSTVQLGNILKASALPAGQVDLQGTLQYATQPNQPLLDAVTMAGQFHSNALAINMPQAHTGIRALKGDYRLSGGTLEVKNVQAGVLGGSLNGNLTIGHLAEQPEAKLAAQVHRVSLAALGTALGANQLKRASISGSLDGKLQGSWVGSGDHLQLKSDATITASAPVRGSAAAGAGTVPVHGALHAAYDSSGVVTIHNSELATPHTTITLDGSTGKQSALNIRAQSDDLREVDQIALIARSLGSTASSAPVQPFGIAGAGTFNGQLRGSLANLQLTGQLSGTKIQYQGTTLTTLAMNVALSPSNVALSQGTLVTSDHGQVQFNLSAGLSDWTYTPQSAVKVDLNATQIPVATLEHLARVQYPVTGILAAHISMHGTESNIAGQGSATLTQANAWNQPIQNLAVQFQGAGSTITSTLQVQTPAGNASGKLSYDFLNQGYDAQFSVPNLQVEKLAAVSSAKEPVTGVITASLQGKGTVKNPQLAATVQATKLVVGQQSFSGSNLQLNVADHKATINLATTSQGASIQGQGNVDLTGDYNATATLDVKNVNLGPLLVAYLPQAPAGLQGHTELHATLHGPLKRKDQVEAELTVPTLNLSYQSLQVGNTEPIQATYRGGVFTLQPFDIKGTGTDLKVQATVPTGLATGIQNQAGGIQAKASGNVDLHLIQLFYPQWDSSGQLTLDVNAAGPMKHPDVHGTIKLVNAVLQPPNAPLGTQNLNATLSINNGRVDIQEFAAQAGGGTLSAQGFATFQPSVQFNVRVEGHEVRLRYPVGTRAVLDSSLLFSGSYDSSLLSGRITIDKLSLTKEFDLSKFADQFTGNSAASSNQGFANNVALNLSVNSATDMSVANSQLSIQGTANLVVRGTAAEPVILGRTDINSGEIFFAGNRYRVDSGGVTFVNPIETEPVVNLHVSTTINQFDITMNFEGPIDRMRTSYTSDPPLAPVDIINLVATGQTTEASSTSPSTPQSVIAGQLTSQVSNRVQKLAGISSLTIDPQVGGGAGNNGVARLGVQQRVTKNLFFSFSTDLTNSAEQVVQVEYQATKRFAIGAMRDQNGIYTLQIKMHKNF